MNKGQISILMAVFNCQDTVGQSIESVLVQTYGNWHFIICDDCSTDGTLETIEGYAKDHPGRFTIIRNEKNSRLAFSLNRCLACAEGEYCARMDGDDYIDSTRFEKQVAFLEDHQDVQLCGTAMQTFDDAGRLGRIISYNQCPSKEDLKKGPCFAHATIMMRTEAYRALGGYTVSPRTKRTQDYDLWFRFFAQGYRGWNLEEPLYFVREDEEAFMRRKPQLYLWATVTRFKGFKLLGFSKSSYIYAMKPLVGLAGNEARKTTVRVKRMLKKG